jgi:hypothetical protein
LKPKAILKASKIAMINIAAQAINTLARGIK